MSLGPNESGPKCVGAQMSWGSNVLGPKWVGAQMCWGPNELGAQMRNGPNCVPALYHTFVQIAFEILHPGAHIGSVHKCPLQPSKQVHVFSNPLQSPFMQPEGLIHWLHVKPVQALLQRHLSGSSQTPCTHSSVQIAKKKRKLTWRYVLKNV